MGLCLIASSISQVTSLTSTSNLAAISHTVAPEPGPRALSAMLVIFNASLAERLQPAADKRCRAFFEFEDSAYNEGGACAQRMYAFEGVGSWRKVEVAELVGFVGVSDDYAHVFAQFLPVFDFGFSAPIRQDCLSGRLTYE